ncbi:MAG: hypothetical protein VX152_08090, partial [Pseudomonadota bacterium]|nr:hypothetical protein [Pseudomonadota bacterium]
VREASLGFASRAATSRPQAGSRERLRSFARDLAAAEELPEAALRAVVRQVRTELAALGAEAQTAAAEERGRLGARRRRRRVALALVRRPEEAATADGAVEPLARRAERGRRAAPVGHAARARALAVVEEREAYPRLLRRGIVERRIVADRREGGFILLSAIDNLTKGSSGQALQNFNLAFGLEEQAGLHLVTAFP